MVRLRQAVACGAHPHRIYLFDPLSNIKKHATTIDACFPFGGLEGDRTLDLTDANRTLSQLSYEPIFCTKIILPQDLIVKTLLCEQKMKDCKMVFFVVK